MTPLGGISAVLGLGLKFGVSTYFTELYGISSLCFLSDK